MNPRFLPTLAGPVLITLVAWAEAQPESAPLPPAEATGRILFTRQILGQDDLYVLDLSSGEETRLTEEPAKDSHGRISADGKRIVFNSERVGWWKIWSMDTDGTNIGQVTFPRGGADYYPDWSPSGKFIVFTSGETGNGDIVVIPAAGGARQPITRGPARDNFPAWSPDGKWIAFASDREGPWAVYVTDLRGEEVRRVSGEIGNAIEPAWSPDSKWLFYQSDANGSFDIYRTGLETGETERLTSKDGDEKRPAVAPNGVSVVFEADWFEGSHLFVLRDITSDRGRIPRKLTFTGYNYGAQWWPEPRE